MFDFDLKYVTRCPDIAFFANFCLQGHLLLHDNDVSRYGVSNEEASRYIAYTALFAYFKVILKCEKSVTFFVLGYAI